MRTEWNERAREDAFYYVAFARRNQDESEFDSTCAEAIRALEADLVRLPPGDPQDRRALEIGCGPGRLMIPMSRHFGEIHGVDISEEMVRMAEQRLKSIPGAHPHVNSGADLPMFPANHFDYVYSYVVFQHIPSREAILSYFDEIARVLKPRGIAVCQYRGAPAFPADPDREPDSWNGCNFNSGELMERAATRGLEVHHLSGEHTQYMWLTFRKRTAAGESRDLSHVELHGVTAPSGAATVPQRGPTAALSLWLSGIPDGCDLNNIRVDVGGTLVSGVYLGPIGVGGSCQLNVLLPPNASIGTVPVRLVIDGQAAGGTRTIDITEAPPRSPRAVRVTDGINLLSNRIVCGVAQLTLVDVEDPRLVTFTLDGNVPERIEFTCVDPLLEEYIFAIWMLEGMAPGPHRLGVRIGDLALPDVDFEIEQAGA